MSYSYVDSEARVHIATLEAKAKLQSELNDNIDKDLKLVHQLILQLMEKMDTK